MVTVDTKPASHMSWACQKASGPCMRWEISFYYLQGSWQRKREEVHRERNMYNKSNTLDAVVTAGCQCTVRKSQFNCGPCHFLLLFSLPFLFFFSSSLFYFFLCQQAMESHLNSNSSSTFASSVVKNQEVNLSDPKFPYSLSGSEYTYLGSLMRTR